MDVQLTWDNPITAEQQQQILALPIAFGRVVEALPVDIDGQPITPFQLLDTNKKISRYHALLRMVEGQLIIEDYSANGSLVDGVRIQRGRHYLSSGSSLGIGNYDLTIVLVNEAVSNPSNDADDTIISPIQPLGLAGNSAPLSSTIIFHPQSDDLQALPPRSIQAHAPSATFPPPEFLAARQVNIDHLPTSLLRETDYAAIGGGIGSFVWVDHLRIGGVKKEQITVLGLQPKPYARYETLLRNNQIYRHKRIRSGSDSCPDNIWGWPGYALRDAWRAFSKGQLPSALGFLWQVFAEPILADTYTPRAKDVFDSIDREAQRIGWKDMWCYASVRNIRKTDDGRYIIAYSATRPDGPPSHGYLLSKYLHLCTGYPAIKLLDDLQRYRITYGDFKSVVHGYEQHDHVYESLERNGGTVVIRGSGIVASQILDKLYQVRKQNPHVFITHLSRAPRHGQRFGLAQRYVENHWEFQPYNWPKGTWGGDMRKMLESADPYRRRELLEAWGGTTTASRREWRQIVNQGLKEGWYTISFGKVRTVKQDEQGRKVIYVQTTQSENKLQADFIIDCTGLISDPQEHPLINDLVTHYHLELNPQNRLHVQNDFEIPKMQNEGARMYAAGIITLGGPYAPVDTFLGLQYAAHRSSESLAQHNAPGIHRVEGLHSAWQWAKWAANSLP
jgi:pSer/pThr/pTyr-binding forkhead associated (FHA) protein